MQAISPRATRTSSDKIDAIYGSEERRAEVWAAMLLRAGQTPLADPLKRNLWRDDARSAEIDGQRAAWNWQSWASTGAGGTRHG